MGNIEQACRFRMDSGYGICAKSPGITPEQEQAVGSVFNDTMNHFFKDLGSSILSCAIEGQHVLYGRNTLRTDIHGRMTIFTHTCVMPLTQYGDLMVHAPEQLLGLSMHDFMGAQSGSEVMKPLQLEACNLESMNRDELFERYDLNDPERYAMLMAGAYEALSGSKGLRLCISDNYGEPQQVIRELVYCICEGLFPSLRKAITFSSGPDTRMNFSILRNREHSSSDDLIFDVTGGTRMNLPSQNKLRTQFFRDLGAASRERRAEILNSIQAWYDDKEKDPSWPDWKKGSWGCTSVPLLINIYAEQNLDLDQDYRFLMFRTYAAAANRDLPLGVTNDRLTFLAEEMERLNEFGTREISHIAEWYLMESNAAFREMAGVILGKSSLEIKTALLGAALQLPTAKNVEDFARTLLKGTLINETNLGPELAKRLVDWIVNGNRLQLMQECELEPKILLSLLETSLKSAHPEQVKDMIRVLAQKLGLDQTVLSPEILRLLMKWIIRENEVELLELCRTEDSVLVGLLNEALRYPEADHVRNMVLALAKKLPLSDEVLGAETKQLLVDWIVRENDVELIKQCSLTDSVRVSVLKSALWSPEKDRLEELIRRLISGLPMDARLLESELKLRMLGWIARTCDLNLYMRAESLLIGCANDEYQQLVARILRDAQLDRERQGSIRMLNGVECRIVSQLLKSFLGEKLELGEPVCKLLDKNTACFDSVLKEDYIEYLLQVRLQKCSENTQKIDLMNRIIGTDEELRSILEIQLQSGGDQEVWECYLAARVLVGTPSFGQLRDLCAIHNRAANTYKPKLLPNGPFEQRVAELLCDDFRKEFPDRESKPLFPGAPMSPFASRKADVLVKWFQLLNKSEFFLSSDAKFLIELMLLQIFWENLTYRDIVQQEYQFKENRIPRQMEQLSKLSPEGELSFALWSACAAYHKNTKDVARLLELLDKPPFRETAGYELTMELVSWLLFRAMEKQKILSMDLLVFYSRPELDQENSFDPERAAKLLMQFQKLIDALPKMSVSQITIQPCCRPKDVNDAKLARRLSRARGELPELTSKILAEFGRSQSEKNLWGRLFGK